ncbi:predicted protein [Nematostella vectensis]|uniref:PARG catalytic Macro domain-containing protein n=1 Tax=Nematostella vectensis TaxID=45351 RepID=A7RR61_NEMVE|nr:predicted protein [Nematostella vectensis]|eukprot:XP_001638174.1 predicted protein [Nematostella vectensis]
MEDIAVSTVRLTLEDKEQQAKIKELFCALRNATTSQEIISTLRKIHKTSGNKIEGRKPQEVGVSVENWPFTGLQIFLEEIASPEEKQGFVNVLLPVIISLASKLTEYSQSEGLEFVCRQTESSVPLNRNFISAVLASGFLCSLPPTPEESSTRTLNFANFFSYFHRPGHRETQAAKLRCFLHYFERLAEVNLDLPGNVIFTRQVDFANCFIGGGVLGCGNTQEEIRFCVSPELMISMLFMEAMEDNEAIIIKGTERFSSYTGYGDEFRYDGDVRDLAQRDMFGNLETTVVAIDATSFKHQPRDKQYEQGMVLRELNKALVGFHSPEVGFNRMSRKRDTEFVDITVTQEEPVAMATVPGIHNLGQLIADRVLQGVWDDMTLNGDRHTDDSGKLLTSLIKKSVEEVFKQTPEKVRIYTEHVTNSALLPKCLQHGEQSSASVSPLVPSTPPCSQNVSGTQSPLFLQVTCSITQSTLSSTSFADSLSKSLLSCVSLTSSLANSITTIANTPLEAASVAKETFRRSPRDLGSPVKNADKFMSYLSQKVYDDASDVQPKQLNYKTISEFTEDLTSVIDVEKSDWSRKESLGGIPQVDSPRESDYLDLCACSEEELEARRTSLAELALNLFEDYASCLARSVMESAFGLFNSPVSLHDTREVNKIESDDDEVTESDNDSTGSDRSDVHDSERDEVVVDEVYTGNGMRDEAVYEEKCDSILEDDFELNEEDMKVERMLRDSRKVLRDNLKVLRDQEACDNNNVLNLNPEIENDVLKMRQSTQQIPEGNNALLAMRDTTDDRQGSMRDNDVSADVSHDSESDSDHGNDLDGDWNSSDIEKEIEDNFFDLDRLSDEEVVYSSFTDLGKEIEDFAAKISGNCISCGIKEAVLSLELNQTQIKQEYEIDYETKQVEHAQHEPVKPVEQAQSEPVKPVEMPQPVPVKHDEQAQPVNERGLENKNYTLSYEDDSDAIAYTAELISKAILQDALKEASKEISQSLEDEDYENRERRDKGDEASEENNRPIRSTGDDTSYIKDDEMILEDKARNRIVDKQEVVASEGIVIDACDGVNVEGVSNASGDVVCIGVQPDNLPHAMLHEFAGVMSQQTIQTASSLVSTMERLSGGTPAPYPVSTGNWGCGLFRGDPQLKAVLQWLAASVAGCPVLVYHTYGYGEMSKFFMVQQSLRQRNTRVCDVMRVVSRFCEKRSSSGSENNEDVNLFELLMTSS